MNSNGNELFTFMAKLGMQLVVTVITMKCVLAMIEQFEPNAKEKKAALAKAKKLMSDLGIKSAEKLTEQETMVASQLVLPSELETSWDDIGGCDDVIVALRENLINPIRLATTHKNPLLRPPKGVLLHGPPGCGKTMIARAIAKDAGCNFINLDISCVMDKWYGESQKIANAVFTFALKIQPCIVFIDEIDSFLRTRSLSDHESTAMVKAQFLAKWDGLQSNGAACVVVIGATNRPQDVDSAVRRRLSSQYYIGPPSEEDRLMILALLLREQEVADCVDLSVLAAHTNAFSGAELTELARNAVIHSANDPSSEEEDEGEGLGPLKMSHFTTALASMRTSQQKINGSFFSN